MVKNGRIECRTEQKLKDKFIKKLKDNNLTLSEFMDLVVKNDIAVIKFVRQSIKKDIQLVNKCQGKNQLEFIS